MMVDERESPSAGWREVYHEMDADPNVEDATRPCPDCGRTCRSVLRDVYECDEHGVFRASARSSDERADAASDERENADGDRRSVGESDDPSDADWTRRARGPAGSV
jgi:hypothetical protein